MEIGSISMSVGSQATTPLDQCKKLTRSFSSTDMSKSTRIQRSYSGDMLCYSMKRMQRSHSDNHLCYCVRASSTTQPKLKKSSSSTIFNLQNLSASLIPHPIRTFLFDSDTKKDSDVENVEENGKELENRSNWIERIMEIHRHWSDKQEKENEFGGMDWHDDSYYEDNNNDDDDDDGGCEVHYDDDENDNDDDDDDDDEVIVDRESFSKMLSHVSWSDAKIFSKLAFLCNMAYVIPQIKAIDLRRYYGLKFVTSSIHKKTKVEDKKEDEKDDDDVDKCLPQAYVAYEIAASAACYVQTLEKDVGSEASNDACCLGEDVESEASNDTCCLGEVEGEGEGEVEIEVEVEVEGGDDCIIRVCNEEMAACVAASTITSVVAANERQKQIAATDLVHTSPVEWFICDDPTTYTRYFIIQGSDSLASWQANLMFEPTKFEGTQVLVHRGIYEAAKGIYEQFVPEIVDHVNRNGDRAKLKFTGHSLGGSLSLLVNLMLLMRKTVKPTSLLPVTTFGSPFVFCGGNNIFEMLGLDENHLQCLIMHRDIVPRAFSCTYPNYVAQILKRLNSTFRSHPCLNQKKMLYTPMGRTFIIQPDEKSSPKHPFLPPGSGLYAMENTKSKKTERFLRGFLNTPHPVETLSDPTAYGSEGTILRDHDSSNYLKAVNHVIRKHIRPLIKKGIKQENVMWPLLTSQSPHAWSHDQNMEDNNLAQKTQVMTNA